MGGGPVGLAAGEAWRDLFDWKLPRRLSFNVYFVIEAIAVVAIGGVVVSPLPFLPFGLPVAWQLNRATESDNRFA
jgi:hypothetical protein